jgi:hypothetical protein
MPSAQSFIPNFLLSSLSAPKLFNSCLAILGEYTKKEFLVFTNNMQLYIYTPLFNILIRE